MQKIKTEITKELKMSLFDYFKLRGEYGTDIGDNDYDWGTYLGCPESWEECKDYYDRCMLLFALNLICSKYNPDRYSCCNVAEFIWAHREAFDRFLNEENRPDYTPAYWLKRGDTIDPDVDGLFYDIYMESFEHLLIGNYNERDYQKLFKYLTEWDKWKNIKKSSFAETRKFVDTYLTDIELQQEDGEQYLITRYAFSSDPNSMMNLNVLNDLYDNIFQEKDYIVVKMCIWEWSEGYDDEEFRRHVNVADVLLVNATNDNGIDISLESTLKTKSLIKSIFNNQKVIDYLMSDTVGSKYKRYIEVFKIKEE